MARTKFTAGRGPMTDAEAAASAAAAAAAAAALPECKFGMGCFRKNPAHFLEFSHPKGHPGAGGAAAAAGGGAAATSNSTPGGTDAASNKRKKADGADGDDDDGENGDDDADGGDDEKSKKKKDDSKVLDIAPDTNESAIDNPMGGDETGLKCDIDCRGDGDASWSDDENNDIPDRYRYPQNLYKNVELSSQKRVWHVLLRVYPTLVTRGSNDLLFPDLAAIITEYLEPLHYRSTWLPQFVQEKEDESGKKAEKKKKKKGRGEDDDDDDGGDDDDEDGGGGSGGSEGDKMPKEPPVHQNLSKYGGKPYISSIRADHAPWPLCRDCKGPLRLWFQIRLDHAPLYAVGCWRPSLVPFFKPLPPKEPKKKAGGGGDDGGGNGGDDDDDDDGDDGGDDDMDDDDDAGSKKSKKSKKKAPPLNRAKSKAAAAKLAKKEAKAKEEAERIAKAKLDEKALVAALPAIDVDAFLKACATPELLQFWKCFGDSVKEAGDGSHGCEEESDPLGPNFVRIVNISTDLNGTDMPIPAGWDFKSMKAADDKRKADDAKETGGRSAASRAKRIKDARGGSGAATAALANPWMDAMGLRTFAEHRILWWLRATDRPMQNDLHERWPAALKGASEDVRDLIHDLEANQPISDDKLGGFNRSYNDMGPGICNKCGRREDIIYQTSEGVIPHMWGDCGLSACFLCPCNKVLFDWRHDE